MRNTITCKLSPQRLRPSDSYRHRVVTDDHTGEEYPDGIPLLWDGDTDFEIAHVFYQPKAVAERATRITVGVTRKTDESDRDLTGPDDVNPDVSAGRWVDKVFRHPVYGKKGDFVRIVVRHNGTGNLIAHHTIVKRFYTTQEPPA